MFGREDNNLKRVREEKKNERKKEDVKVEIIYLDESPKLKRPQFER